MEPILNYIKNDVKILLIDFDDTLADYPTTQNSALTKLFDHYNIDITNYPEVFKEYTEINEELWGNLENGSMTIDEVRVKRFEILQEKYPLIGDPRLIDDQYLIYFSESTSIPQQILNQIGILKKYFIIAIVTNGIKRIQEERVKNTNLLSLIDYLVTSEDVGVAKPDPKMFHQVLSYFNLKTNQAVVIGDSLNSDIQGAENANIASIWIGKGRENSTSLTPSLIVQDFEEFADLLLNLYDEK